VPARVFTNASGGHKTRPYQTIHAAVFTTSWVSPKLDAANDSLLILFCTEIPDEPGEKRTNHGLGTAIRKSVCFVRSVVKKFFIRAWQNVSNSLFNLSFSAQTRLKPLKTWYNYSE
jgi:hypothetical protein